jgi:hypothetical protein
MGNEKQYIWTDKDLVEDYTEPIKKLWDNLVPPSFPQIKSFETLGVKWVEHKETMGPYYRFEQNLKFLVKLELHISFLNDAGWKNGEKVSQKTFDTAYGENFLYNVRGRMLSLVKFVGMNLSQFDLEGDFNINAS